MTNPDSLRSAKSRVVDLLSVFGVLTAMLVANDDWIYTPPGWLDPWIYFGFFRHYNVADYLTSRKEVARLPWILLGFIANHLATPVIAELLLHAACYAAGVFFLYAVIVRLFGRIVAVITSLVYITYVPLHGSGGWDYHNTLLPVLFFSAYLALMSATRRAGKPFLSFFKFGILFALVAHTNILALLVTPAFAVRGAHNVRNWMSRAYLGRWLGQALGGTVLGGLAITIVLGAINVAFGRPFFFPGMLISRSLFLLHRTDVEKIWWVPWTSGWWLIEEHTPMFEAVLFSIAVVTLISWRRWSVRGLIASSTACAMLEFVLSFAPFAIAQAKGHPLLTPFYMLAPAALPMFVAIAALIAVAVGRVALSEKSESVVVVASACIIGIEFIGHYAINVLSIGWHPQPWYNWPPFALIVGGLVVASIVSRIPFGASSTAQSAFAFGCVALALGQANTIWPFGSTTWTPYEYWNRCPQHRALLSAIVQFDEAMFRRLQLGKHVLPWYSDPESAAASATCQLYSWQIGGPLFAMAYGAGTLGPWDVRPNPAIPEAVVKTLSPGTDQIALITNDPQYVDSTLARLRLGGHPWKDVAVTTIGGYGMFFKVHLLDAVPQITR